MIDTVTSLDLVSCDQEPIRTPGSIQPHGLMLVADNHTRAVLHVAGDVEQRLGVLAWHGKPLTALIGDLLSRELSDLDRSGAPNGFLGQLIGTGGELFDVSMQLSDGYIIVELEAATSEVLSASRAIDRLANLAAEFERAPSLTALCARAAVAFRKLTGFDRVMIYRFLPDDAGMVVAEDRHPGLKSFLNHHFPASDIPKQARALYIRNLVRVIPDVAYAPAPLRPEWVSPQPLDMSDSSLRSVSPIHLLYLSNMGVKASASFSIVDDGKLWGLVACHNEQPLLLSYDVRAACRSLVGSLARTIRAREEAEGLRQRLRLRSFENDVVALLSSDGVLDGELPRRLLDIMQMMAGDGVAVMRGLELVKAGSCPADPDILQMAAWLTGTAREPVFATNHLQAVYPPATALTQPCSGLLAITLSIEEPWVVMWFRAEFVEVVEWAGNPHKDDAFNPQAVLRPRTSFEAWTETVQGRSRAWSMPEIAAATRLRAAVLENRQNQRVAELNRQLTRILQDKDTLLQQKEFLIGEVNHRVQNSLTLVSSFLSLQARASTDPALSVALQEARRRLTAVALVHRRLYRGDHIEVVDIARYVEELCVDTFSFMGPEWAGHLTLRLSPVFISTDRAVTLGLVLTELLINSNKHAYGGDAGPIEIELVEDRTQFQLIVTDQGVGHDAEPKGFGSRIMEGLIRQLGGTLTRVDHKPGLRAIVTVPVLEVRQQKL